MKKETTSQTLKHAAQAAWKVVSNPKHHKAVVRGIQKTNQILHNMRESIDEVIEVR